MLTTDKTQNNPQADTINRPTHGLSRPDLSEGDEDTAGDTSDFGTYDTEEANPSTSPPTDDPTSGVPPLPSSQPLLSINITPAPPQKTLHSYFRLPADPVPPPPLPQILKRQQSQDEGSDSPPPKKPRVQGTSKSALAEAKYRAEADRGVVDHQKLENFKKKILILDPYAEFLVNNNARFVLHSKCAGVNKQKAPYNTTNFVNHVQTCTGPPKKRAHIANTDKKCLTDFIAGDAPGPSTSRATGPHPEIDLPCPGLTPERDSRIPTYLTRSQAAGGGSRPRHTISRELFAKPLGDLDKDEFAGILQLEAAEFRWLNFREQQFVRASACLKKSPSRREPAEPCNACVTVSKDPIFKNALARKFPKEENLKFVPHHRRAEPTGL